MKVLSIREPYATLIKDNKKRIETRSWKTNYRGELYIHASGTNIFEKNKKEELMKMIENRPLNFGYIICKCNLVDCVYMTEEFVNDMMRDNCQEYICGDYSVGRYAWILEKIEPLDIPIKAKGQLNIWNYYNEFEIMDMMNNIKYGWVDRNNNKYIDIYERFSDNYLLQSPKDIIKNKIGLCWDQVELERYYFKTNDWNIKTYFLVYYDGDECPTHTFLTYEKDNRYYWFEHAWEKFIGIHEYDTRKELLIDVRDKFIKCELGDKCKRSNLFLYEYKKPKNHIFVSEFYNHCENGICIDLEK